MFFKYQVFKFRKHEFYLLKAMVELWRHLVQMMENLDSCTVTPGLQSNRNFPMEKRLSEVTQKHLHGSLNKMCLKYLNTKKRSFGLVYPLLRKFKTTYCQRVHGNKQTV